MSDAYIGPDHSRAWLDQYNVSAPVPANPKKKVDDTAGKDSFPHRSYDWMQTAQEGEKLSLVNKVDLLVPRQPEQLLAPAVSGGVAVMTGKDNAGNQSYGVREAAELFPWMLHRHSETPKSNSLDDENRKLAQGNAAKAGLTSGLLAALGRFIITPVGKAMDLFQRFSSRVFDAVVGPITAFVNSSRALLGQAIKITEPVWKPIGRGVERATNWVGRQADTLSSYVSNSLQWLGKAGRQVLDTLIIEAPKAAVSTIRDLISKFSSWLGG
ncbi:MAG: hypothetical protein Q8K75_12195 [Chlamydiales bacterium]|nr:hypothetical protein [Chlamydiales bacterium]